MVTIQITSKFTIRKADVESYEEFIELAKHDPRFKERKANSKDYKKFELSRVITALWKFYSNKRKAELLNKGEQNDETRSNLHQT